MSTRYDIPGANAQDEGTFLGLGNVFNFTGAGVTASIGAGGVVTVAIPGGGAGGTPSLPFTSVQFNNAGAFGGSANFTWDGTGLTVSNGALLNSYLTPAALTLNTNNSGTISVKNGAADAALNLDILDLQINGASGSLGQVLTSGGAGASPTWSAIPAASGWVDGGTTVYLATTTDVVSIGSNTPVTNRKLSVYNTGTNLGASIVTLASTDNVIETFVTAEANVRWSVNGSGITSWGAGGASVPDLRIRRSGTSTLTIDNGAAGSVAVNPGGDGVGSIGSASLRWLDIISNTFRVFPSAGAVNASTSLGSAFLKLGAGGATALDTAITRTASKTLTVDDNAAGSMVLIVKGSTNTQQRIHGAVSKAFVDSPYTTAATDEMVFWSCTGGNCTQNLPTPVGALGRTLIVKRTDTTANTLTLTPAAGQVEGGASLIISGGANRASITLMSDNANWWVI
jgi:hypothetical protein